MLKGVAGFIRPKHRASSHGYKIIRPKYIKSLNEVAQEHLLIHSPYLAIHALLILTSSSSLCACSFDGYGIALASIADPTMAPTLTSIRLLTALIPLFLNIPSTLASSSPLTFPLVPDKSFHLVPAEELVQSILGVWGINIQLDLAIDLGLTNVDLGVDLGSRSRFEERRSRLRVGVDSAVTRDSERTQEKRGLLGFNAGSGWGLFGSPGSTGGGGLSATVATVLPTTSQSTAAGVATASAKSSAPLTLNVGTNVDLDAVVGSSMNGYLDLGLGLGSGSQGWGEAENVAKGEQGDTEVSPLTKYLSC